MIGVKDDYWLSRRLRFTADEAFHIGINFLLEGSTYASLKPLDFAAKMGHCEAKFVVDSLNAWIELKQVEIKHHYETLADWVLRLYDNGNETRGLKYVVWFPKSKTIAESAENRQWIHELADQGEAIGQYLLARQLNKINYQHGVELYTKATDQNFTPAFHKLTKLYDYLPGKKFSRIRKLYRDGAILGNWHCLRVIIDIANEYQQETEAEIDAELNPGDLMHFRILQQFIKSGFRQDVEKLIYILRQLNHNSSRSAALGEIYLAGRMFDDYQACYPKLDNKELKKLGRKCAVIYRQMIGKARRAAVHTILTLRAVGVCRNVAILIAKLVYASRVEAAWYIAGG